MQSQVREGVRLSPQQKHVWSLQQDDQRHYRSQCVVYIEGKLSMDTFAAALQETVRRHEILRSIFFRLPSINVPLQVVTETEILPNAQLDLSTLTPQQQEEKIEELLRELSQADFNLEQGSLLRTRIAALAVDRWALLVTTPALYCDAGGLRNLVAEIGRCYAVRLEGTLLEDNPIQYADLAEWHNELLESEETDAARSYWQKQGRSCPPSNRLPFELNVASSSGFVPTSLSTNVKPEVFEKLVALTGGDETSISSFLLGCWQVLLAHLTGQVNVVIGAFFDGRKYEELKDAIGLFARHLPLQCRITKDLPFGELLKEVDEKLSAVFKWQEYFDWDHFDQSRLNGAGNSFFPFCFEFEGDWPNYSSDHLEFTFQRQYSCFDRFKIKLCCTRRQGRLSVAAHHDSELFRQEDIDRLLSEFHTLLESAVANPNSPIGELEILGALERQQLLVDLNSRKSELSQQHFVPQLFEQAAALSPYYIALRYEDSYLSYHELNTRANQLAYYLQKSGVGADTPVAIFLERSMEIVVSILAILKAGGAYVPLDPAAPRERLSYMLNDLRAPVIVTLERMRDALPAHHAEVVCLDTGRRKIARESKGNPANSAKAHHLAYIIYTSGSTGYPKGVAIEHRQLLNYINSISQELAVTGRPNFATVSTFAADLGNTVVFPALCSGGSLHVISPERATNPDALGDYFRSHEIDCLKIVPSHLAALLETSRPENIVPRQWLVLGGESCSWELIKQIRDLPGHCQILGHYGPTEATIGVLTYKVNADEIRPLTKNIPLGRPLTNEQVYILNSYLRPASIWMQGELYIGGIGVARGYLNQPALTAAKFIPDPFSGQMGARLYKTGDLARFLPDGNIEFLGRVDHQVKISGYRIEPGEIEAILRQHPSIKDALVVPCEDASGSKRLVVYFLSLNAQDIDTNELRDFLRTHLPEYMVPSTFVLLKEFPLTSNGKIDYQSLSGLDQVSSRVKAPFVAPRDQLEQEIVEIWQEILGVSPIGIADNFFVLGGHSLLAVRLVALIQKRLGRTLPLAALFRDATVEHLAGLLRQESGPKVGSPLIGIQTNGSKRPLFCVHPSGGLIFCYGALSHYLGADQPFYGFQARGVDGEQAPHTSIEEMAADYIEALRSVQAKGPYSLGGWSMGGLIAFEMAQQLKEQGEEIDLLALMDTRNLNRFAHRAPIDDLDLTVGFGMLLGLSAEDLRLSASHLLKLEAEEQFDYVVAKAKAASVIVPETDFNQIRHLFQIVKLHAQARKDYLPKPYPGRITLFRAAQPFSSAPTRSRVINALRGPSQAAKAFRRVVQAFLDPTMGWGEIAAHGVRFYETPGNHFTMIREPHTRVLAERLRDCLKDSSTTPPSQV